MEDAQQLAEAVFESLRRHVMMARLAPSGGAVMALLKVRQSYSVSRHRPIYLDFAHRDGVQLVVEPTLTTEQIDNQLTTFGPGTEIFRWFNRAWIPSFYEEWDGDYRHRLAVLLEKKADQVKVGYFGDLRLIRNDIIHHKAQVTEADRSKCSVLQWFDRGNEIELNNSHYTELFDKFPWNKFGATTPEPASPTPVNTTIPASPLAALQWLQRNGGFVR
ncbi:hypothetical protein G8767_12730 [Rhodococcus sp. IC4_135]|uniref:hypothetical protein n=1 Tax=Rhodococcus TaxID=1827 RepID=UPI00141FD653|nr:hypothetical protein [Rhodococcus sp. IC4_135]